MFLIIKLLLSRLFDYGLFYFVIVVMSLIVPVDLGNLLFFWGAIAVPVAWIPLEAVWLRWEGTTPGKKLFGLTLPRLSWRQALCRALTFMPPADLIVRPMGWKQALIGLACVHGAVSALFLGHSIADMAVRYEGSVTTSGWVQYVSDDGKFRVHFPKQPKEISQALDSPEGGEINLNEVKAYKKAEFSVSYLDLPKKWKLFSANILLKGAMKVILEHLTGTQLLEHTIVKHKNYPAMDFRLQEGDKLIEGRLILVDNTLYKLWVVYFSDTPREQQHEAFLDSFELIQK